MDGRAGVCAIVEPRDHPALEEAVRQVATSGVCSSVLLLHGTLNAEAAGSAARALNSMPGSPPASLHQLDVANLTPEEYSDLLYTTEFWDVLQAADVSRSDRALVFQTDSGVCSTRGNMHAPPRAFLRALEYEMCGAPYADMHGVNGGLSTRSISASQRVLRENALPLSGVETPEDVFFSYHLGVCPHEVALAFSCESLLGDREPFGFHASWKHLEDIDRLEAGCPNLRRIQSLNTPNLGSMPSLFT